MVYATATPTLAVAAHLADAVTTPAGAQLADIVDFTDASPWLRFPRSTCS